MGLCNSSPWDAFNPGWQAYCQCLIILSGECVGNNVVVLGISAYFIVTCNRPLPEEDGLPCGQVPRWRFLFCSWWKFCFTVSDCQPMKHTCKGALYRRNALQTSGYHKLSNKRALCCWTTFLSKFFTAYLLLITVPYGGGGGNDTMFGSKLEKSWPHGVPHPLRTFLLCYVGSYLNRRSSPTSEYANIFILMTEEVKDTWIAEVLVQYVRLNEK